MRNKRQNRSFLNSSFLIGIAIVSVSILLGSYFFGDEAINYKEIPYDTLVEDEYFYGDSHYPDWHTINMRAFKIETPTSYRFFKERGIDSYVGGITNQQDTLFFDYGWYSNPLSEYDTMPGFEVSFESVNGRQFKMIKELKERGIVGIYTNDLDDDYSLMIYCNDCHDIEEKIRMFRTIRF